MTVGEVTGKVNAILVELLGVDRDLVTPDASLADLGCDSLDRVEVALAIEEVFEIDSRSTYPEDGWMTVADVQAFAVAACCGPDVEAQP